MQAKPWQILIIAVGVAAAGAVVWMAAQSMRPKGATLSPEQRRAGQEQFMKQWGWMVEQMKKLGQRGAGAAAPGPPQGMLEQMKKQEQRGASGGADAPGQTPPAGGSAAPARSSSGFSPGPPPSGAGR